MIKKYLLLAVALLMSLSVSAQTETTRIQGPYGRLAVDVAKPAAEKSPVVILMHGFSGQRRSLLFDEIFNKLLSSGIGAIRFDFDGHGESDGRFVDMTVPKEIDDAKAVYEYAKSLPWVSDVYLLGHSQGGVVASMLAGELGDTKVSGLALLAPAAVLRDDAIRGDNQGARYDATNPPESVKLPGRDLAIGRQYILTAQTLPIYDTARKYQGPALMLHGTSDVVVPYTYSLRYDEIYHTGSLHLIKGCDHGFRGFEQYAAKLVTDFFANTVRDYVL